MDGRRMGLKARLSHAGGRLRESLCRGWYVKGDPESENRKRLVKFNLSSAIINNLIGGNFFTGLLLLLQADDSFIGLINIIIFSCNMMQLFTPYILERFEKRKRMLILLRIVIHSLNIVVVGLVPLFPGSVAARLSIMVLVQVLINGINAFSAPAMTVWHIAHVPQEVRVSYFSTVSLINGTFVAVLNLLAARLADSFRNSPIALLGLELLRVLAIAVAVYDIWTLSRIEELPRAKTQKVKLLEMLLRPWKKKVYLRTVLITVIWQMAVNLPGAYYSVYLLKEVHFSYSYITAISLMNLFVLSLVMPIWRRFYTKYKWLLPLSMAIMLHALHYVILSFVSEKTVFLYPIGMLWAFVCSAGVNLGFSGLAYINLPEENQTLYLGFYTTAGNLGALFAASLSRELIIRFQGVRTQIFSVLFVEKQLLMLLVGCLVLLVGVVVNSIYRRNKKQGYQL